MAVFRCIVIIIEEGVKYAKKSRVDYRPRFADLQGY